MNCHHTVDVDIDGDMCIQIDALTPKAIKLHSCNECNRIIQRGEHYRRDILKYGSKIFHHKYCDNCLSVREVFFSNGWYYEQMWEQMTDFIAESDGRISEYQLTQLTKTARDKILDAIEKYWAEQDTLMGD